MKQKIAVILVNWNSFSITADCILSLKESNPTNYDIIVVDNGSSDNSIASFKERFTDIILIESATNRGFSGGNNLALQYAIDHKYEYVFLLNNDTFVQPGLLQSLSAFMDTHADAGAVQPIIFFHHDRALLWNGGSGYNAWLGLPYTNGYNKRPATSNRQTKQVAWITGCAFFIRTSILKTTGLLSENMFMYGEDVDFSFRVRQHGYTLYYHPESSVYHIAGMSGKTIEKGAEGFVNPVVHYYNVRNRIWLLKKHTRPHHAPTAILFNLFYIVALMAYFAIRRYPRKLNSVLQGVKDGLKGKIIYQ